MGISYLHPQGEPNNGANRYINGTNSNVRVPVSIPAGTYWTGGWSVVGGSGIASVSYDGATFRINGSNGVNLSFRGGEPGTAGSQTARGYFGDSLYYTWTGGMGGYIVWAYNAPGAPNAPSVSRSANGTSLTATTGGGSGRITYYNVALNGVTGWQGNGHNFTGLGAHTTYNVIARAGNEDNASGNSGTTVSYGIPTAPKSVSATRSTSVAGQIDLSWSAPDYTGAGITKYQVYRGSTLIRDSGTSTTFSDTGRTRGVSYSYTIYAVNSTGVGIVSATVSAIAPGIPSAPGVPTISSKLGRTLTINSTRGSLDYGNSISEYRIQLSTDNGVTWRGWNNTSKTPTDENTYNVLDSSGNFEYQLLTPALNYLWRVAAVNSVGVGDYAVTPTSTFVSAGGKRFDGTSWIPTATSKRYDGSNWIDFTIAKRWNGTTWDDLT
jgi:hypothetical protein